MHVAYLVLQALETLHVLGLLLFHGVLVAQLKLAVRHFTLLDFGGDLEHAILNIPGTVVGAEAMRSRFV